MENKTQHFARIETMRPYGAGRDDRGDYSCASAPEVGEEHCLDGVAYKYVSVEPAEPLNIDAGLSRQRWHVVARRALF